MSQCYTITSIGARQIRSIKVKCDNNGCPWVGELGSLDAHLQSCDYALLPCTNKCKIDNEIAKFLRRKDLKDHLTNDCPRRQYKCSYCKETGEYQERITTHLDTCPKVKVLCPNPQCPVGNFRSQIDSHRSTCKYETVRCKYAEVGCKERLVRQELSKHEEDDQFHLRVTTVKVLELTKMNRYLLKSTSRVPCTVRLANYLKYKSDADEFCSPPFYTSYTGYKMCINVYANGLGDGNGTHVSVYAHLMKGDNDDSLSWPFTGKVTFELLNQLEDKNHHQETTLFRADSKSSQRVVERERASLGYGRPKFISHADLDYKSDKNTKYLKDDTLMFRVSVQVPDYKPWLECTL